MDKKAKIALTVIKKVYDSFPETQEIIDKASGGIEREHWPEMG